MRHGCLKWGPALLALALVAGCSGSDGKHAGTNRIVATGGAGTRNGGSGGAIAISSNSGGDVALVRDGEVPAAPAVRWQRPGLGANPLTISGAVTRTTTSSGLLGDDGTTAATGLWVQKGAVLTLVPPEGEYSAAIALEQGVLVEGTVQTAAPAGLAAVNRASLQIEAGNLVVTEDGTLTTTGDDVSVGNGGNGGAIGIYVGGSIFNAGRILARGGRGETGGSGFPIELSAAGGWAVNTGTIDSSGGAATNGLAAGAGEIALYADAGTAVNAGTIAARGGEGTSGGGEGNAVWVECGTRGAAYAVGTLDVSGGAASAGFGGSGGIVFLESSGGDAVLGGVVRARGGAGTGPDSSGGAGGWLEISASAVNDGFAYVPAGSVVVGADIDLSGGAGAWGREGGRVYVDASSEIAGAVEPQIRFVGYAALELSGGAGDEVGGGGGGLMVSTSPRGGLEAAYRLGGITNEVPITADGGASASGNGGSGGGVYLVASAQDGGAELSAATPAGSEADVVNRGALSARGAGGGTGSGSGGTVVLQATRLARNEGGVVATGGAGAAGAGGGEVVVFGPVEAVLTGQVDVSGGAGSTGAGGFGGYALIYGGTASANAVSANGGATAAPASSGSAGGDGGFVQLLSTLGMSGGRGLVSVAGGGGEAPGLVGRVVIDGIDVALTDGALSR